MIATRTKYLSKRTACGFGHVHASKKEAKRCDELHLLARAGEITGLQVQPAYALWAMKGRPAADEAETVGSYIADFSYREKGKLVVEDVKSPYLARNPLFRLKARLIKANYDIDIKLT